MDRRFDAVDQSIDNLQTSIEERLRSLRNEVKARIDAVRSDIKCLGNIDELRERLSSVEARMAQRN